MSVTFGEANSRTHTVIIADNLLSKEQAFLSIKLTWIKIDVLIVASKSA